MLLFILSSFMVIKGDNFFQGKWDGAAISKQGIFLSYSYKKVIDDINELVTDVYKAGKNIYVGTAEGNIYLIQGGKKKEIFNSGGNYVVFGGGKRLLLAGISPQGKLFRIKGDKVSPYLNLNVDYIWDILTNNRGDIFVGTGSDGKIFRIKRGVKDLYYQANAKNIISLLLKNNTLFATTSYPGLIYKISSKNKAKVYFDPIMDEVKGIGFSGDTLYITGNNGNAKNVEGIIMMTNDGIDTIYTGDIILSATQWMGKMLAGESQDGEIGWIKNGKITILYDFPEKKITALKSLSHNELLVGTGTGAIYLIKDKYLKSGSFISDVLDGGIGVKWGRITTSSQIPRGTNVKFFVRGGFTSSPDSSWTIWKEVKGEIPISTRFIQLKATLITKVSSKTPRIKKIFISYMEENQAPIINAVQALPPGVGWGTAQSKLLGRRPLSQEDIMRYKRMGIKLKEGSFYLPPSLRCITFEVNDPNGDPVNVSLILRMKGSKFSDTLSTNILGNAFFFDNTTFPEGKYILTIIAKDKPQGNVSKTKSKQIDLVIDNTPPKFEDVKISKKGNTTLIQGSVKDNLSNIQAIFVNIDGKEWLPIESNDKIYDEKEENFSEKYHLTKGRHRISLRVIDEMNNKRTITEVVSVK